MDFERIQAAANFIKEKIQSGPEIGLILGSGLRVRNLLLVRW